MQLTPGIQVGPYQVLSVLGAGGMAEVYRARDTRLGREVALKVVNAALAGDPELVRRFEQEARVAGSLKHPNVVAVYDVGRHEGVPYFVTELLEGESLRQRLTRGRIPLQTALEWGAQLARGLAAAHARGVIHRDVKPDNVFVSPDGQVKLLDFGIAKLAEAAQRGGPHGLMDATVTPTRRVHPDRSRARHSRLHVPGAAAGRVARRAVRPVQPRGGAARAPLGRPRLPGPLLRREWLRHPPQRADPAPAELPTQVAQVVLRCLEKEPGRRFQSASDLAFALEVLRGGARSEVERTLPARPHRPRLPLAGVALLALGFAAGSIAWSRTHPSVPVSLPTVEQVTFRWGAVRAARFAPDGRVFFSATFEGRPEEVFTRPVGSAMSQPLGLSSARLLAVSGTGELAVLLAPRFSVLFTAHGTLARVPGVGGTPREVAEDVEYADWSPGGELALVTVRGTARTLEFPPGRALFQTDGWLSDPRVSRRGDLIAFVHHPIFGDSMGEVTVVDLQGTTRTLTPRLPTIQGLAWAPADVEIWFTSGELQRNLLQAVDLEGRVRDIYRTPSDIHLDDVAADGSVLLRNQFERNEVQAVDVGRTPGSSLLDGLDELHRSGFERPEGPLQRGEPGDDPDGRPALAGCPPERGRFPRAGARRRRGFGSFPRRTLGAGPEQLRPTCWKPCPLARGRRGGTPWVGSR